MAAVPLFTVTPLRRVEGWFLRCEMCKDAIECETPEVGDMLKLHFVMKHRAGEA